MNMPIAWTVWWLWLLVSFAALETYAFKTGTWSLSYYMYRLSVDWPPIIGIYFGLVIGVGLHFWWHWNPTPEANAPGG